MKENYLKLKNEYIAAGGNEKWLRSLPKFYTLQAEAKLRAAIRRLKKPRNTIKNEVITSKKSIPKKYDKNSVVGLIGDYPLDLHDVFLKRRQAFLSACSLKMQLNIIPVENEKQALSIQWQIIKLIDAVDVFTTILLHYKKTGRILSFDNKPDYSNLSDMELLQKRNTLRSNLTSRKKTIARLEKNLPAKKHPKYLAKSDKLTRKKEELFELEQQIEKLNQLINEK